MMRQPPADVPSAIADAQVMITPRRNIVPALAHHRHIEPMRAFCLGMIREVTDQGHRDDAHRFLSIVRSMRQRHETGGEQLQFFEDAIDPGR